MLIKSRNSSNFCFFLTLHVLYLILIIFCMDTYKEFENFRINFFFEYSIKAREASRRIFNFFAAGRATMDTVGSGFLE